MVMVYPVLMEDVENVRRPAIMARPRFYVNFLVAGCRIESDLLAMDVSGVHLPVRLRDDIARQDKKCGWIACLPSLAYYRANRACPAHSGRFGTGKARNVSRLAIS
jgi:hypothetical protein